MSCNVVIKHNLEFNESKIIYAIYYKYQIYQIIQI